MSIDRKTPEIIKHAWQSKQKTEIDMTTTGSSLIQENIRIYAERLIAMEFKGRGRTGESSGDIQDKRRQRLIKEITYALHELRGLVKLAGYRRRYSGRQTVWHGAQDQADSRCNGIHGGLRDTRQACTATAF